MTAPDSKTVSATALNQPAAAIPSSASGAGTVLDDRPFVTPLAVFAAGRERFDAIVRPGRVLEHLGLDVKCYPNSIKALIFDQLCLERYGWAFQKSRLSKIGETPFGDSIWNLARGEAA